MRVMRMYLKRVTLCVLGLLATSFILVTQLMVTYNSGGTDDNFAINRRLNKIVANVDPSDVDPSKNNVVGDEKLSYKTTDYEVRRAPDLLPVANMDTSRQNFFVKGGSRKLNAKPPSHEELPPLVNVVRKNGSRGLKKSADDAKIGADDGVYAKYLASAKRVAKNPDIVALAAALPLDTLLAENPCTNDTTLGTFWYQKYRKNWPRTDSWERFYAQIGTCDLYRNKSEFVDELLQDISTMTIKQITNMDSGTQVKFLITFENDKKALFKPMRFGRSFETHPDQFYFTDFERHTAEIAAFHLDRLLGFRRAIPTVGRIVNMSSELWANADKALARTFFYSPAKNLCFVGKCDYYCDTTHAVCGHPDTVEGSFQVFLPDDEAVPRDHARSPYKRTYSKRTQEAVWQKDNSYCEWKVKYTPPYSNGRSLLDLVDLYILDFLMGNQDRHHYETFTGFGHTVYFLHLDNGRAFGKTKEDDMDILAPLTQCCVIRPATLSTLLKFYNGPTALGEALKASLSKDPVAPILAEKHYVAIDRRLETVLKAVQKCIKKSGGDYTKVLVNRYYNPDAPTTIHESEEDDE